MNYAVNGTISLLGRLSYLPKPTEIRSLVTAKRKSREKGCSSGASQVKKNTRSGLETDNI